MWFAFRPVVHVDPQTMMAKTFSAVLPVDGRLSYVNLLL